MTTRTTLSMALAAMLLLVGCAESGPENEPSAEYIPTATIADVMYAIIDPSADQIWDAVATVVNLDGIHEEFPETDEEWDAVRSAAIRVIEGSNLLLVPGRRVAEPGAVAESTDIELGPEEIQALIDQDWDQWVELAHELHDMASVSLAAADARDTEALLYSGEGLDIACERCHLQYWYPNDDSARRLFEESEQLRLELSAEDPQ